MSNGKYIEDLVRNDICCKVYYKVIKKVEEKIIKDRFSGLSGFSRLSYPVIIKIRKKIYDSVRNQVCNKVMDGKI